MSSTIPARTSLTSVRGRALRGTTAAIIGLGMLLTSACGSDDSDDSASAAEDSSQEEADDAQDDAASEEDEADDAADDGGSDSDYCAKLEQMGNDFLSRMEAPGEGEDTEFTTMLNEIAAAAPSDIAPDWQALADMYETMANIDLTDPEAAAELNDLGDIEGAGQRIQQHVEDECA